MEACKEIEDLPEESICDCIQRGEWGSKIFNRTRDDLDLEQKSIIHYAAHGDSVEVLQFLYSNGFDLGQPDGRKTTPFQIAIREGCSRAAEFILKTLGPSVWKSKDIYGNDAEKYGKYNQDLVRRLKCTDEKEFSSLIAKELRKKQYDKVGEMIKDNPQFSNIEYKGLPIILYAVLKENIKLVRALIDAGADIERVSYPYNLTPLCLAVITKNFEIAKLLYEKGADPYRGQKKKRAIDYAVSSGSEFIELFSKDEVKKSSMESIKNSSSDITKKSSALELAKSSTDASKDSPSEIVKSSSDIPKFSDNIGRLPDKNSSSNIPKSLSLDKAKKRSINLSKDLDTSKNYSNVNRKSTLDINKNSSDSIRKSTLDVNKNSSDSIRKSTLDVNKNSSDSIRKSTLDTKKNSSDSIRKSTLDINKNSSDSIRKSTLDTKKNSSDSIRKSTLDVNKNSSDSIRKSTLDVNKNSSDSIRKSTLDINKNSSDSIRKSTLDIKKTLTSGLHQKITAELSKDPSPGIPMSSSGAKSRHNSQLSRTHRRKEDFRPPPIETAEKQSKKSTLYDLYKNRELYKIIEALRRDREIENEVVGFKMPILHFAAYYNDDSFIQALLENGANVNLLHGNTALHVAASHGKEDAVKVLVAAGADITIRDLNGKTPYEVAANDVIKELISPKRRDRRRKKKANTYTIDDLRNLYKENSDKIGEIIKSNPELQKENIFRRPILIEAAAEGKTEIIKAVLDNGGDVNITCNRGTALWAAVIYENVDAVKLLISYGADVNYSLNRQTLKDAAKECGNQEITNIICGKPITHIKTTMRRKSVHKPTDTDDVNLKSNARSKEIRVVSSPILRDTSKDNKLSASRRPKRVPPR